MSVPLPSKNIAQVVISYVDWILGGSSPKSRAPKTDAARNAGGANKKQAQPRNTHQDERAIPTNIETRIGETTDISAALEIGIRNLVDHIAPGGVQIYADCVEIVGEAWVRVWFIEDMPPVMGRAQLESLYNFHAEIRHSLQILPLDKSAVREQLRQRRTSLHFR